MNIRIPFLLLVLSAIPFTVSADDDRDDHHQAKHAKPRFDTPTATSSVFLDASPARLLASNCFQCHGTHGTGGFEDLRGNEAKEIVEFRAKTANRNIMAAHAHGYTSQQIDMIISYFAANP
jgi:sulfide dehydrogenase cytochrome subunit